jgi:DNA-directed RNA polymerase subunit beta'
VGNKILVHAGDIVDKKIAETIEESSVEVVKVRSPISCKTLYGICAACYGFDLGNNQPIKIGEAVGIVAAQSIGEPGTQLTMRTFHIGGIAGADITHGLPRVEEIFEARPPKGRAYMATEDGIVEAVEEKGLLKMIRVQSGGAKSGVVNEYPATKGSEIFVKAGDEVKKGQQLSEGNLDIKELLSLRGVEAVRQYIVNEVQRIYISEGASINNKHIEIIIRQMFSRVKIKESGDTNFVPGEVIEKAKFLEVNRAAKKEGKSPAKAKQILMPITKVALSTESFLSSASCQETARVLINAAVEGKVDILRGLKENVIIGRLIPVGTGLHAHENLVGNVEEGSDAAEVGTAN